MKTYKEAYFKLLEEVKTLRNKISKDELKSKGYKKGVNDICNRILDYGAFMIIEEGTNNKKS